MKGIEQSINPQSPETAVFVPKPTYVAAMAIRARNAADANQSEAIANNTGTFSQDQIENLLEYRKRLVSQQLSRIFDQLESDADIDNVRELFPGHDHLTHLISEEDGEKSTVSYRYTRESYGNLINLLLNGGLEIGKFAPYPMANSVFRAILH